MLALALDSGQRSFSRPATPSFALPVCAVLVAVSVACTSARAQVGGFAAFTPAEVSIDKPQPAFTLPAQSADVKEALDEFARLAKHEQWEKAFKSLETIASKTSTGFIDRGDGVLVPSRLLVRGLLSGMSSAGKNAYRLFYDSQATVLWDKAAGKGEVENLTSILNNHLISSVGDRAADRLGDLYFEQGDFEQAIAAWQSILSYCPDSKLPKAQELIKIATALARAGRWDEFSAIERTLREKYAAESVEIAGRRVGVVDQIARLASARSSEPVAEAAMPLPDDFDLPTEVEPLWQFRFQSKPDPTNSNQPFALTDIYGRQRANDFVIPAAADERRVYANLFGVEMAFDVETGKLLWRSGKLHLLQTQQNRQGVAPERYSIMVSGDRTWSVLRDAQQNNQGAGFSLVARDAATGKEVFNTRRSLSAWNILGPPYLAGDAAAGGPLPATPAATAPAGPATPPAIDFADGFAGAASQLSLNGTVARLAGKNLELTDGHNSQKSSAFFNKPVSVTVFSTKFSFQPTKAMADGMTWTLQGGAPTALGKSGDGLGYQGIARSVAVKFSLFGSGNLQSTSGMYLRGEAPGATGEVNLAPSGIDLHSEHVFNVGVDYDGTTLQVTITDATTQATSTQSYAVNIPEIVGGPTAYVGFTAATGGLSAVQHVLSWTYTAALPLPHKADVQTAGVVYVGASRTGQGRELAVLVLNAKDGKLIKNITVGNYAVDQNQVYGDRTAQPTFLMNRDRLVIDTHGGALVSIQPRTGTLDWGTLYESPAPMTGYYYDYQPPALGMSGPIRAGGLLFTKGMRSTRLLGLQADVPTLAWSRPVSKAAVIVGADNDRIYLGGEELTAYSLKTKELLWATQLPRSAAWCWPLLTKNRLYQFTSRGICEVDTGSGEVLRIFRGADLDSFGGTMFLTPTAVVTVSNLAITAYPRNPSAPKAQTH